MAITRTIVTPISAAAPLSPGPGLIRRIAALPADIDGRDAFQFLITWIEDHLLDEGFLVTWEELQAGLLFDFPITWTEAGLVTDFLITWPEEPEGLDEAYDRDPQIIWARMTKP